MATGYSCVAALSVLVWDTITQIPDEVEYVWGWPNGWATWLYRFVRYCPLVAEIMVFSFFTQPHFRPDLSFSYNTCAWSALFESVTQTCIVGAVEAISVIRVFVIYNKSKKLLFAMIALYISSLVASMIGLFAQSSSVHFDTLCRVTHAPDSQIAGWLAPVVCEAVLCTLVLFKFAKNFQMVPTLKRQPILYVCVRDAVWAFLLILVVSIVTALSYTIFPYVASAGFYFWNLTMYSFAGSHVMLNLRQVATDAGQCSSFSLSEFEDEYGDIIFVPQDLAPKRAREDGSSDILHASEDSERTSHTDAMV